MEKNKIFIVGTPIGNLEDITIRAINTLKEVDYIACEDTRVTKKLLNHLNIKNKKLIAYHNFNEKQAARGIINLVELGMKVALVSDAGMPLISDPGFNLVKEARLNNIEVIVIPGVSAVTTLITLSGKSSRFIFMGFPKDKINQMKKEIENLTDGNYVFFVSPHKLMNFLEISNLIFMGKEKISIAKELTKIHEFYAEGTSQEIIDLINQEKLSLKGEFCLILEINQKIKKIKVNKYSSVKNIIN